jgi:hypothetical protein
MDSVSLHSKFSYIKLAYSDSQIRAIFAEKAAWWKPAGTVIWNELEIQHVATRMQEEGSSPAMSRNRRELKRGFDAVRKVKRHRNIAFDVAAPCI